MILKSIKNIGFQNKLIKIGAISEDFQVQDFIYVTKLSWQKILYNVRDPWADPCGAPCWVINLFNIFFGNFLLVLGCTFIRRHLLRLVSWYRVAQIWKRRVDRTINKRNKKTQSTSDALVCGKMHADLRDDFGQAWIDGGRRAYGRKNFSLSGMENFLPNEWSILVINALGFRKL